MSPPMPVDEIDRLKARLAYFEEEGRWNLFAFDLLASLGDLHGDVSRNREPREIFARARQALKRVMNFRAIAFYTVEESDFSFTPCVCDPPEARQAVQQEVDRQVESGSFAWALNQNRPILIEGGAQTHFVLHVLATKLRVRGMFVGMLEEEAPKLPGERLYLLSIIIHYTANAIESSSLYARLYDYSQNIEAQVRERTLALSAQTEELKREIQERRRMEAELERHRERLEEMVRERTAELETVNLALRESERRFHTLAEHSPAGVFRVDADGRCLYLNDRLREWTGLTLEDARGEGWPRCLHPDDRERVVAAWQEAVRGQTGFKMEYRFRRPDNGRVSVFCQATPERDEAGKVCGFIGSVIDVTELKLAEENLDKMQGRLRHAEKLNALGKLAGMLSHEISNPLCGIRNIIEQAHNESGLRMKADLRELLALGIRECDRMAELIRKLQGICRPSAGARARVDLRRAMDDMLLLTQRKLAAAGIKVEKRYAGDVPAIYAVEDEIKQVFLNLLHNAEDAIGENAAERRIMVEMEKADGGARITVHDTGCGIAAEHLRSIFEPFFTTKAERGTGLGLAITRDIVQKHNGAITAHSQPGKGASFTVTLPAGEESA